MNAGEIVAGRYRLERPLGEGGMGAVWAATHTVTYKAVALKFLHKKNDDEAARKRVVREARAASAVRHPNVVSIHDVFEDADGTPILVMDLLEGESLADKLTRERTLSPKDAVAVVRPILSALASASAIGVVHRDLKPDNIFLLDRNVSEVRILDFGVAKLSGKELATKETNRLTETGAMIGTPHYMAPEQAFGEADVDARADLWAVGAVLYECLSGTTPTNGDNLGQILKVLASGRIVPLRERVPDAPPALAAIVDDLLRLEKSERPASAAIVLARIDALEQLSETKSVASDHAAPRVEARSVTPAPAVRDRSAAGRGGSRAWIAAAAAAAAIATVGGGSALFLAWREAARATAPSAAASPVVAAASLSPSGPPEPTPSALPEPMPSASVAAVPVPGAREKPAPKRAPGPRPAAASTGTAATRSPLLDNPTF